MAEMSRHRRGKVVVALTLFLLTAIIAIAIILTLSLAKTHYDHTKRLKLAKEQELEKADEELSLIHI